MIKINVSLKTDPYSIIIGHQTLNSIGACLKKLNIGKDAVIITNPILRKLYGNILSSSLRKNGISVKMLVVPDGERSKSAKVALNLIEEVARFDVLKQVFIIAFGGGVIGDLAGYVAAAYKRGVPYVQVPTSFLAQIDSAIGGKVAIDLPIGKNLVGAFHQPKVVYSDVSLIKTLPKRQIKNGFAEAIKYGIIKDKKLFIQIENEFNQILQADTKTLLSIVDQCSRIKANVVVADEKETKGIRTILNFGHTAGHAIEAAAGFSSYQHGEAIAVGMRIAADISLQLKLISAKKVERINALLTNVGLPEKIQGIKLTEIMRIMKHDKKFQQGKNRFVLLKDIGKVIVVQGIKEEIIKKAVNKFLVK